MWGVRSRCQLQEVGIVHFVRDATLTFKYSDVYGPSCYRPVPSSSRQCLEAVGNGWFVLLRVAIATAGNLGVNCLI
jgi:hypothetical protein